MQRVDQKEKCYTGMELIHNYSFCLCYAEDFVRLEEILSRFPWKLPVQILSSARGIVFSLLLFVLTLTNGLLCWL